VFDCVIVITFCYLFWSLVIEQTSGVSKLLFWWITPLLYKGFKSDLELKDMDQVAQTDKAKLLEKGLLIHFSPTQSKPKASDFSLT
jgi:hypothetical protein